SWWHNSRRPLVKFKFAAVHDIFGAQTAQERTTLITGIENRLPSLTIMRPRALAAAVCTTARCLPRRASCISPHAVIGLISKTAPCSKSTFLRNGMQNFAGVTTYSAHVPPLTLGSAAAQATCRPLTSSVPVGPDLSELRLNSSSLDNSTPRYSH